MHKIKSITIHGFRRQKAPIKLELDEEANFLIGRNGTGKTSLINLINACLTVDYDVLTNTIFRSVVIRFKQRGKLTVPSIEVEKLDHREVDAYARYSIRKRANTEPDIFDLTFGRRRVISQFLDGKRVIISRPDNIREVKKALEGLFKHTWLSLHRGHEFLEDAINPEYDDEHDRPEIVSGVDRKLNEVLQKLREYYFSLDRRVADQTSQFQKDWFLSFLATKSSNTDVLNTKIDFEEEKKTIATIFNRFDVPTSAYESLLENHVKFGIEALGNLKNNKGFQISEFFNLYDVVRLHRLVEQWQELQERQKAVLEPKTAFVTIASEMLYKKKISLNQGNEVIVEADDQLNIPVEKLSSGEKQLLIFLAETLLQQKQPYIFLADEPELSLHVEWQEQLVSNLLKVNPNAQVLFATHSPDIVGRYGDHIFSMEKLVL